MPPTAISTRSPWAILAVLCLAVLTINFSATIMNVALPTLVGELGASNRNLQWIVDGFNLTFAALVLAAGSLSDRFGRKRALVVGLAIFGAAGLGGSTSGDAGTLVAWRALMGVGAAVIFPTTLSIIANVFTDRRSRAQAIGIWGATTGLAVATGPITGGALLTTFWWGSTMLVLVPLAVVSIVLTLAVVPDSRDPAAPPLDRRGLVLSTLLLTALVGTIIEAPEHGWTSGFTLGGLTLTAILLALFVAVERRVAVPMLDVALFRNLRFSAASGAVTLAFFCLFGFIFLMTQYFQLIKAYSPLETGVRLLPVAVAIGASSVFGPRLAIQLGTKLVITAGLACLAVVYAWISRADAATSYGEVMGQMILLGIGMGFTTAPATEAIMGVVPKEKAGVGSSVNDATRELGGTLGVAVFGSIFASVYQDRFTATAIGGELPAPLLEQVRGSLGSALLTADEIARGGQATLAEQVAAVARNAFVDGLAAACLVAAATAAVAAVLAAILVPSQPQASLTDSPAD